LYGDLVVVKRHSSPSYFHYLRMFVLLLQTSKEATTGVLPTSQLPGFGDFTLLLATSLYYWRPQSASVSVSAVCHIDCQFDEGGK